VPVQAQEVTQARAFSPYGPGVALAKGDSGQASVEYAGLICLIALCALAGLATTAQPRLGVARALESAICTALRAPCEDLRESLPAQHEVLDAVLAMSLPEFQAYEASPSRDARMDYSDDDCSAPIVGSSGLGFDFTEPCERHDFGYRNAKRLGLFEELKDEVDRIFLEDMRATCAARPPVMGSHCRAMAEVFYAGVRAGGGSCDPPGPIERLPGPCARPHG
jgi:Flp pilus assembly pilin Flp